LHPSHVAISVLRLTLRGEVHDTVTMPANLSGGAAAWSAPLDALRVWLETTDIEARSIEFALSDDFVRYAIVPWADDIQTKAELAALARAVFDNTFGAAVAEWDIKVDLSTFGQAGLACAIDNRLTAEIHALLGHHGLRLRGLQPNFMRIFNCWNAQVGTEALVASFSEGRCVIAGVRCGAWHSIRSFGVAAAESLEAVIRRELLVQGLAQDTPLFLHSMRGHRSQELGRIEGAQVFNLAEVRNKRVATAVLRGEAA
jgi:hypothetical protein